MLTEDRDHEGYSQVGHAAPDSSTVIPTQGAAAWRIPPEVLRRTPQRCSLLSCVPTIELVHRRRFSRNAVTRLAIGGPLRHRASHTGFDDLLLQI